jgi:hypothetical protein
MHVFPDLHRLERKYPKELVVIGVHSAKFENEKDSESIRQAILRHDLEHPVVNDANFAIFNAYGARGWPHFTLIDPEGNIIGSTSGEGNYETFVKAIDATIRKFDAKIDRKEKTWALEKAKETPGALAFPGKILATASRLFIADSHHNRVVITDLSGRIQDAVGGPEEGLQDGSYAQARFNAPQGLALREETLYVADCDNHAIRAVDLRSKTVKTVAGTGKQQWHGPGGSALEAGLNSPWDLAIDGDRLFIAMAGNHQIWLLDLAAARIGPFSGSGGEKLLDGPHPSACFSQPSGLSLGNGHLYVADAEVSGVREVDLDPKGKVRTLLGTGLFDFGDKDGVGDEARQQHVMGVLWHQGQLYIADAYNHKIKVVNPSTRAVRTFLGDGTKGKSDGKAARFQEPSGLSAWGDRLYIADTNNHQIRICDLKTGAVSTLPVTQ